MGVQAMDYSTEYCLRRKGGNSLIDYPPVFSPDGQSLLVICGGTVRVYNVRTAECAHVLQPEGGSGGRLIAIGFPPGEQHNVYGCADDGLVTVWTWEQGRAILREKKLELPPQCKVLTFNILDQNECFITACEIEDSKLYLAKHCLKSGVQLIKYDSTTIELNKILRVAVGLNGEQQFAAICNGTKFLHICDLSKPYIKSHQNYNGIRVVCVAAHPSEGCVVSGDALGRATVWRGSLLGDDGVVRETLHWHSLPLLAVAFSLQGGYLLSGGMEKVVVKWHLGGLAASARHMDTMPRLPGAVRFLAVNSTYIAVATTNNSITITTPQLGLVSTIIECGGLSQTKRALGPGLVCHRPLAALLLGGRAGHLQLYSISTDKLLYNVDITGLNNIPPTRHNLWPADTELTCAASSADGSWLVTSEYRSDGATYPEERLKFWAASADATSPFKLNTCVNFSHGGCPVVAIAVNKTGDFCVSAGTDQKLRIWKREENTRNHNKRVSWSCLTACYYAPGVGASLDHSLFKPKAVESRVDEFTDPYLRDNNSKNDVISRVLGLTDDSSNNANDVGSIRTKEAIEADVEMGGVAISQDGSLIAAWFGSKLTLWDSHSCSLRSTLSHPSLRPKGVDVCFGNEDAAHFVVCTTEHCVAVWSLLSLSVRWLVHARPVTLAADPFSNLMAVVTDNNDVFAFTPHRSTPVLSRRAVLDARGGVLRHAAFGPANSPHHLRLYFTRNDSEIYCLEPEGAADAALEQVSRVSLPASNYSALLASKQTSEVQRGAATDLTPSALPPQAQFFSAAPHMVPSISLLCSAFLQQLSGYSEPGPEEPTDTEMPSEDEASSDDDLHDRTDPAPRVTTKKVEFWRPNYEETKEKRVKKILKQPVLALELLKGIFD